MVKQLKILLILFSLILFPILINFSHASDLQTIKRVIDGDTLLLENGERV